MVLFLTGMLAWPVIVRLLWFSGICWMLRRDYLAKKQDHHWTRNYKDRTPKPKPYRLQVKQTFLAYMGELKAFYTPTYLNAHFIGYSGSVSFGWLGQQCFWAFRCYKAQGPWVWYRLQVGNFVSPEVPWFKTEKMRNDWRYKNWKAYQ